MQRRPITVLMVVLLACVPVQASAGEHRKQAQLRISMTIVDSCDVELVRSRPGAAAEAARVACSTFMPHQSIMAKPPALAADRRPAQANSPGPAQPATVTDLSALSAGDLPPSYTDTVLVATVTF